MARENDAQTLGRRAPGADTPITAAPGRDALVMIDQAVVRFAEYQRTGRLDLLNAAITLFREAVACWRAQLRCKLYSIQHSSFTTVHRARSDH